MYISRLGCHFALAPLITYWQTLETPPIICTTFFFGTISLFPHSFTLPTSFPLEFTSQSRCWNPRLHLNKGFSALDRCQGSLMGIKQYSSSTFPCYTFSPISYLIDQTRPISYVEVDYLHFTGAKCRHRYFCRGTLVLMSLTCCGIYLEVKQ